MVRSGEYKQIFGIPSGNVISLSEMVIFHLRATFLPFLPVIAVQVSFSKQYIWMSGDELFLSLHLHDVFAVKIALGFLKNNPYFTVFRNNIFLTRSRKWPERSRSPFLVFFFILFYLFYFVSETFNCDDVL